MDDIFARQRAIYEAHRRKSLSIGPGTDGSSSAAGGGLDVAVGSSPSLTTCSMFGASESGKLRRSLAPSGSTLAMLDRQETAAATGVGSNGSSSGGGGQLCGICGTIDSRVATVHCVQCGPLCGICLQVG